MTRVDFYILGSSAPPEGPERVACRLAEKAWQAGHSVLIQTSSETAAQRMDDLLWTYRAESFVPHGLYPDASDQRPPVLVGHGAEPNGSMDVLINLTQTVPAYYGSFARIAEVVGGAHEARELGRERYRFYRNHGCSLHSHEL